MTRPDGRASARKSFILMILGTLIFFLCSVSSATVPNMINYQGKLTTASGGCLNDTVEMTFSIYPDTTGSPADWTETQLQVAVQNGIFNVLLGSVTPISASVFDGDIKYLGVQIEADPEMTPLKPMVSVPYAYRAGAADGGGGGGGWVDDGTVVRLETASDWVGIGTASPTAKLQVSGDVFISGKATIGSNHINDGVGGFVAGTENYTSGSQPVVSGGNFNGAFGAQATVGGGYLNYANGDRTTVGGGSNNLASNDNATVGGGKYNKARGLYSTVAGGGGLVSLDSNSVHGDYSSIGGGRRNVVTGSESTIGGGYSNTANATRTTVGGGRDNTASGNYSTVGGGNNNTASGTESTVAGGNNNAATQYLATVGGGSGNDATGSRSTVGGGDGNTASGSRSTVGGGDGNTASDDYSTIGGGRDNTASGLYSTVGGGYNNRNFGNYCVIPGGYSDTVTVSADYSMAFGRGVFVSADYAVVFFDGSNSGKLRINRDNRDGVTTYPIRVGTNSGNGNGAYLTSGGTWTDGSSKKFKDNFQPLDGGELLAKISSMPVDAWNYKDSDERHIGPVAEDFVEAFDVGAIREDGTRENQYLAARDVAGVALAGVKELARENQEARQGNQELREIIEELKQRITKLENGQ